MAGRTPVDYTEAIRLDPNYAEPYHNRGNAYHRKGEYDNAIAASSVLEMSPHGPFRK